MTRLYCATGNAGKLREFRMAADSTQVEIELLPDYRQLPAAVEDGATFEENALRKARFVCAIALVEGERVAGVYHGAVEGAILDEPRGSGGFGYDPLFYCPAFGCTFGEATAEQKFSLSHRGQAVRAMLASL